MNSGIGKINKELFIDVFTTASAIPVFAKVIASVPEMVGLVEIVISLNTSHPNVTTLPAGVSLTYTSLYRTFNPE